LKISKVYSDMIATVRLSGEFDIETSGTARDAILNIIKKSRMDVIVDMGGVIYLDSSGLATLIECYKEANQRGIQCAFANLNDRVYKVVKVSRLHTVLPLFPSVESAVAAIDEKRRSRDGD